MKNSIQRFREIVTVLGFYGFGYIVDSKLNKERKSPDNLRKAFEELGPTFVKIGQILSTRPDILPAIYIEELQKLQDKVSSENYEDINKVFSKEFGKSIDEVFKKFDKVPLASASIAQVHTAILKNGKEVIVKIQRPNIEEKMLLDLSILSRLAKLTKARFQDTLIDPIEAIDELLDSTILELDFRIEVKNIDKFRELNKNVAFLHAPEVVHNLSGKRVITMERIHGFKINDLSKLDAGGYDRKDVANKFILSFFKQIFEDSFFHGDPHPGNILIKEGKICYLDFGIIGTLSPYLTDALNDVIVAVTYNDINKIISTLMSIGIKKGYVNRNKLYEDIDYLFASYLSTSLKNIKMSYMLQEVFETAKRNNIQLPKELTLLIRSMVIVEGVVAEIDPDMNLLAVAIPYVKSNNKFSLLNKIDFDEALLKSYRFLKDTSRLPSKIIDLTDSILNGRAKIQLQVNGLNKAVNDINKMANRLILALILSSMIIGSSLILNTNIGPKVYNISIIGVTGYLLAAILGFWLIISIIRSKKM